MSNHKIHWPANLIGAWSRGLTVPRLGLLMTVLLTITGVDYLGSKASSQVQGVSIRTCWYFRSGQWQADIRTLAAALEFVLDSVPQAPAGTNPPTKRLAAPSRPVGPNPPTMTQVKAGGLGLTIS